MEVGRGERHQDHLLTGSPGHCLIEAGWGYCFHTSGTRDLSKESISDLTDSEIAGARTVG